MGWDPKVFEEAQFKLNESLQNDFSKSVRKLCNYGIAPKAIESILDINGRLTSDWQLALHNHIHTAIFKKEVNDLNVGEVIQAFNDLNTNLSLETRNKIAKQLSEVLDQFNKPLDGSENNVSAWTKEEVTHWCTQIKKLTSRTAKEEKLVPILAVAMRAVELANTKYIPRATQIISALASLNTVDKKGRLLQIATGEGKSISTAIIASVRALWGDKVDIASSSEVLSNRDAKEQKGVYDLLAVTCADAVEDDEAALQKAYLADVVYGTIHLFSAHVLLEEFEGKVRRGKRSYDILFIDEADSLLVDQIDVYTQLSKPMAGMESMLPLLAVIQKRVSDALHQGKTIETIREETFDYLEYELGGKSDESLKILQHLRKLALYQIPLWVESVLRAYFYHRKDKDHMVSDNGAICPIDYQHTGVVHTNQVFSDGGHQFLQLRAESYLTAENFVGSFISPLSYVRRYEGKISGLTGTLGNDVTQSFMKDVYNVDFVSIPSYRPKQLKEYEHKVLDDGNAWSDAIIQSIMDETSSGRGVLVLFETKGNLENVKNIFMKQYPDFPREKIHCYFRNDLRNENEQKLPKPLGSGQVVFATNLAGRGTDLELVTEMEACGGLHVCTTFLPLNERVETQSFGRTARQGKKGTAQPQPRNHAIFVTRLSFMLRGY